MSITKYVSTTGGGSQDGSSVANAYSSANIGTAIDAVNAAGGGIVYVCSGTYSNITFTLKGGTSAANRLALLGYEVAGGGMPRFTGSRHNPPSALYTNYTYSSGFVSTLDPGWQNNGGNCITLGNGQNYIEIGFINIDHYNVCIYNTNSPIVNGTWNGYPSNANYNYDLYIHDCNFDSCKTALYLCSVDTITIDDCKHTNFTKKGYDFRGCRNGTVNRVTGVGDEPWSGGDAAWTTSTVYPVGSCVSNSGNIYHCYKAHTSGTFATDLANGYWTLVGVSGSRYYGCERDTSGVHYDSGGVEDSSTHVQIAQNSSTWSFTDCTMHHIANRSTNVGVTGYGQGDGWAGEKFANGFTFTNCLAHHNGDAGWDIKATTTMTNCIAYKNKRNFKFWRNNKTLINCLGHHCKQSMTEDYHPVNLWVGDADQPYEVECTECTFHNVAPGNTGLIVSIENNLASTATITLNDSIFSSDGVSGALKDGTLTLFDGPSSFATPGSISWDGTNGTNPQFVNPTQDFSGGGNNYNSAVNLGYEETEGSSSSSSSSMSSSSSSYSSSSTSSSSSSMSSSSSSSGSASYQGITLLQTRTYNSEFSEASSTLAFTNNLYGNSLIVVQQMCYGGGGISASNPPTATGRTFYLAGTVGLSGNYTMATWYAYNQASGPCSITVYRTSGEDYGNTFTISEWYGVQITSDPLDTYSAMNTGYSSLAESAQLTMSNDCLIIAQCATDRTVLPTATFTSLYSSGSYSDSYKTAFAGTETASFNISGTRTWYVNAAVFKKAPPLSFDHYSETNRNYDFIVRSGGTTAVGQSFEGDGNKLDSCKFYLKKFGAPTGSCYGQLYAMNGTFGVDGVPTGSILSTSNPVDVSTFSTTNYSFFTFSFNSVYQMTAGNKYVIVFRYNTGGDASNYVLVGADNTPTHEGNKVSYIGTWVSDANYDVCFAVYSTPGDVSSSSSSSSFSSSSNSSSSHSSSSSSSSSANSSSSSSSSSVSISSSSSSSSSSSLSSSSSSSSSRSSSSSSSSQSSSSFSSSSFSSSSSSYSSSSSSSSANSSSSSSSSSSASAPTLLTDYWKVIYGSNASGTLETDWWSVDYPIDVGIRIKTTEGIKIVSGALLKETHKFRIKTGAGTYGIPIVDADNPWAGGWKIKTGVGRIKSTIFLP